MNIQLFNQEPTMTSREIAELLESRHDHVKTSIERLVKSGVISQPAMKDGEKSANGVIEKLYVICKRDTYVIVAQLSPAFTARLVDRWQELETKQSTPIQLPQDYLSALKALTIEVEARQTLQLELQAAKPALEFVDKYVDSTGLKGFSEVAKLLGIKQNELRAFLTDNKIMFKLGGKWTAYAQHLDAGRFEIRAFVTEGGYSGTECKFSPKGIKWLAGEIAKSKIDD